MKTGRMIKLEDALRDMAEYLEQRADADLPAGATGPQPNEEMRLLQIVNDALEIDEKNDLQNKLQAIAHLADMRGITIKLGNLGIYLSIEWTDSPYGYYALFGRKRVQSAARFLSWDEINGAEDGTLFVEVCDMLKSRRDNGEGSREWYT